MVEAMVVGIDHSSSAERPRVAVNTLKHRFFNLKRIAPKLRRQTKPLNEAQVDDGVGELQ